MRLLRRVLGALALAGLFAAGLRLRGRGGTPPQHGGWRQLELTPEPSGHVDPAGPSRAAS